MTQRPLPADDSPDADWRRTFAPDPSRVIEIGGKYRQNPATAYCWTGCETCAPGHGPRCWQRKTELDMTYRVRELLHTDYQHATGRRFLVSLVRPTMWTLRSFTMGASTMDRTPRAKWHTITGIVSEADLGGSPM